MPMYTTTLSLDCFFDTLLHESLHLVRHARLAIEYVLVIIVPLFEVYYTIPHQM